MKAKVIGDYDGRLYERQTAWSRVDACSTTVRNARSRSNPTFFRALRLLVVVASTGVGAVQADPIVWNGTTDGDWNTGSNWVGGVVPDESDKAVYHAPAATNLAVALSGDSTVDGLEFNAEAIDPVTIQVSGATLLHLDGGAQTDIAVLTGSHRIEGAGNESGDPPEMMASGSEQIWHIAEGASLTIDARLNSRPWPNNGTTYRKQGPGTLVLNAFNGGSGGWNFTGGGFFYVDDGILNMTHRSACGNTGNAFTVNTGATLLLTDAATKYGCDNSLLRINGAGFEGLGALFIDRPGEVTNFNAGSGSLNLTADATIGVGANSTFRISQNITGSGLGSSLTKKGPGELILLSPDNSWGGNGGNKRTTVSDGTLTLHADGELRLRLLDGGNGHCINGTGTLNLDGLLRLSETSVTESVGLWHLVNVDTLAVTWGENFGLAFLDDEQPFVNQGGGIHTRDDWHFNQATGNLTRGDHLLDEKIFTDRFEPDDNPPSGCL